MFQHLVDRVGVEQPLVHRLGFDLIGNLSVVPFEGVPLFLFVFAQVVVPDTLPLELERHRHALHRHQKAVLHRVIQVIRVGRHTSLEIEQAVVLKSTSSFGVAVRPTSSESKYSKMARYF